MLIDRRSFSAGIAFLAAGIAISHKANAADLVREPVHEDGIVGELHHPAGARRLTTVVMLNGSDGGIPSGKDAADLAAAGYTVLALAYFKDWNGRPEGLPNTLRDIPLEYFHQAIDWLKMRPEVDPRRVVLMGQSRGAELALLLGTRRPDVAGVVAFSPSSWVWHAIGAPDAAAWTERGAAVPFRTSANGPSLSPYEQFAQAPAMAGARIPVERIRGPVLLLSSTSDGLWPAATYADEIAARLRRNRRKVENLKFADASHLLMGTGPGITRFQIPGTTMTFDFGGTAAGTERARREAWSAAKRFLAAL